MHFNKLSILKVSSSEICKEKYRKYFLFVLKHMVLKLACVHFKNVVLLLSIRIYIFILKYIFFFPFFHWSLGEDESILEADPLSSGCLPLELLGVLTEKIIR